MGRPKGDRAAMEPLRLAIVEGRKRKGWTQEEAAEAVGVSVRAWRYLEAGGMVTLPGPARWRRLTELLEVQGHDLLIKLGYIRLAVVLSCLTLWNEEGCLYQSIALWLADRLRGV